MPTETSKIILVSANPDYPATSNLSTVKTELDWDFNPKFNISQNVIFPPTDGNERFSCRKIAEPEVSLDGNGDPTVHYEYRFSSLGVGQP